MEKSCIEYVQKVAREGGEADPSSAAKLEQLLQALDRFELDYRKRQLGPIPTEIILRTAEFLDSRETKLNCLTLNKELLGQAHFPWPDDEEKTYREIWDEGILSANVQFSSDSQQVLHVHQREHDDGAIFGVMDARRGIVNEVKCCQGCTYFAFSPTQDKIVSIATSTTSSRGPQTSLHLTMVEKTNNYSQFTLSDEGEFQVSGHRERVLSQNFTPSGKNIFLELERDEERYDISLEPCTYSYIIWSVERKAIISTRKFSKRLSVVVATDSFILWGDDYSTCLHLLPHDNADQSKSLCLELDHPLHVTDLAVNPINQNRIAYVANLDNVGEGEYELGVVEICLTGEQAFGVTLTSQNIQVELSDCHETNLSWFDDGKRLKLHSEELMKVLAFDEDVQAVTQGPSTEEKLLATLIDKANTRFQSVLRLDPDAEIVCFHVSPDCKTLVYCSLFACNRGAGDYEDLSRIAIVTL